MEQNEPKDWITAMIEREAIPKAAREDTVVAFCAKWGVAEDTYYYHSRKKETKKKVVEIWLNEAIDGGNVVLMKLKEKAEGGDTKAIEMYLKFVLKLKEELDITTDGEKLGKGIDDKEFDGLMAAYARRKESSGIEEVV